MFEFLEFFARGGMTRCLAWPRLMMPVLPNDFDPKKAASYALAGAGVGHGDQVRDVLALRLGSQVAAIII